MAEFVVVDQTDLSIVFNFTTNLANYTGSLHYYLFSSGTSSSTSVVGTISTETAILSTLTYNVNADAPIFTTAGMWIVWPEIVSSTSRFRSGEPVWVEVRDKSLP